MSCETSKRSSGVALYALAALAVLAGTALIAGCPGNAAVGNSDGTVAGGAQAGSPSVEPDPAGAENILQRVPKTVAFAADDQTRVAQVIDENGNLHEFLVLTNDSGQQYPAEYHYESNGATLSVATNPSGQIEQIDFSDATTGAWMQIAFSWSDATHALANMTTSADASTQAFDVALSAPLPSAKAIRPEAAAAIPLPKRALRAQPTAEQSLSLPVRIIFQDASGNPVTGLRPVFRLRAANGKATFGVARGDEIGAAGSYWAMIPAYRWQRVANDYPEWKPTFDWAVYTVAAVSLLLVTVPMSAPVSAAVAVAGALGTTFVPGVVDRVMSGEYSNVPYPTALGQQIQNFEVRVSARDRKNTTVICPLTYDDLYNNYVQPTSWGGLFSEPKKFLDLGTVIVEPNFQPKAPSYRLYLLPQIGQGQYEVLPEGSENQQLRLCDFSGGGNNCTIMVQLQPVSPPFPTEAEAVNTLCTQVSSVSVWPLGVGPVANFGGNDNRFLSYAVYDILKNCVTNK